MPSIHSSAMQVIIMQSNRLVVKQIPSKKGEIHARMCVDFVTMASPITTTPTAATRYVECLTKCLHADQQAAPWQRLALARHPELLADWRKTHDSQVLSCTLWHWHARRTHCRTSKRWRGRVRQVRSAIGNWHNTCASSGRCLSKACRPTVDL